MQVTRGPPELVALWQVRLFPTKIVLEISFLFILCSFYFTFLVVLSWFLSKWFDGSINSIKIVWFRDVIDRSITSRNQAFLTISIKMVRKCKGKWWKWPKMLDFKKGSIDRALFCISVSLSVSLHFLFDGPFSKIIHVHRISLVQEPPPLASLAPVEKM